MTAVEPRPFDFREIASLDDSGVTMRAWVAKASSYFADFWSDVSQYAAKVSLASIKTEVFEAALENAPRENMCCIADFKGHRPSLIHGSSADFRIVLSEMLGLPADNDPIEGALSPIELSLIDVLITNLLESLSESWMGPEALEIVAGDVTKDPRKVRIFRGKDLVTLCEIEIELNAGKAKLNWIISKRKASELLNTVIDRRANNSEPVKVSEFAVAQLPIDLVTVLGKAKIPMSKLSNLTPGEVILLDQRIDRPLSVLVDNVPFYECWPGQVANQQALEIAETLVD